MASIYGKLVVNQIVVPWEELCLGVVGRKDANSSGRQVAILVPALDGPGLLHIQ